MPDQSLLAVDYAPYITGAFALVGSLVGVVVAVRLASNGREEERRRWLNDQRQQVYPKFIAAAQSVLAACEDLVLIGTGEESGQLEDADEPEESDEPAECDEPEEGDGPGDGDEPGENASSQEERSELFRELRSGYRELVVHNAVIQALGSRRTIRESRRHVYTLLALIDVCTGRTVDPRVGELLSGARASRHWALLAMRRELHIPDTEGLDDDLEARPEPVRVPASG
jgi:hypothetical protein